MATTAGSVGGQTVTVTTSTALQTALAQIILSASSASLISTSPATVAGGASGTTSLYSVDTVPGGILFGDANSTGGQYSLLTGGGVQAFFTNGAAASYVAGADGGGNYAIVNNSASSALIAETEASSNVLAGFAGANLFGTGAGGVDIVFLDGVANNLSSNAVDNVLVGGPSTITAGATAIDNVTLTQGTFLAFINNNKTTTETITGASGGLIAVAGSGNTSINGGNAASGAAPESFFIDTSAGNVTLNAGVAGNTASPISVPESINFVKDASAGTANVVVNNLQPADTINIYGYTTAANPAGYTTAASGSNTVLTLSDGSKVTFVGVSSLTVTPH